MLVLSIIIMVVVQCWEILLSALMIGNKVHCEVAIYALKYEVE